MNRNDVDRNLKLLIGYSSSITQVCKQIKISRQQFTKYLSGKSFPRLQSLQRICDYFGLEDWEILLPHQEFRKLIALNPPQGISNNRSYANEFVSDIRNKSLPDRSLAPFLGFYYNHFIVKARESMIQRSLVHLFEVDGIVGTKTIERIANHDGTIDVSKYDGIAYYSGHRLYISERENFLGHTIWHTTLYATTTKREQFFSGLGLGNTTDSVQDISCYRSIFQFLGRSVNMRDALRGCGLFGLDDMEIPAYIREHIENKIEIGDNAFVAA
jgi:transcriptional regulator with XRE-family HTH domain